MGVCFFFWGTWPHLAWIWQRRPVKQTWCVRVTDIRNTTSEVSTDAASAAYDGVRDDDHVAVVDRVRRPFHLSALPGGVQAERLPRRQWEWRVAAWAGRWGQRLHAAGGNHSGPASKLLLRVPHSAGAARWRAGRAWHCQSAEWTFQDQVSWCVHFTELSFNSTAGIITMVQWHRLRWYEHVLRKGENDWVEKCMDFEMEGVRSRARPKRTWSDVMGR